MAKIGTAHIEIKPVLDEEALDVIAKKIEDAVATGVHRGMAAASSGSTHYAVVTPEIRELIQEIVKDVREQGRQMARARRDGATSA